MSKRAISKRADAAIAEGLLLQRAGKFREAEARFAAVLQRDPAHLEANNAMGVLGIEMLKLDAAIAFLQKARAAGPTDPRVLNNLGLAHNLADRPDEALPLLKSAVRFAPASYDILCNLGRSFQRLGIAGEGVPYLRRAVRQQPDRPEAIQLLADTLASSGETEEACDLYRQVLRVSKLHRGALYGLATVRKQTAADNVLTDIEAALAMNDGNQVAQSMLHYAAAKTLMDLSDPDRAFAAIERAKALQIKRMDREKEAARFGRLKTLFNSELLSAKADLGPDDDTPVFIVGLPRSGTSLVEQIIASHPLVYGAGELGYVHAIANKLLFSLPTLDFYVEQIARLDEIDTKAIAASYLRKVREFSATAKLITDKMPHNFMHLGLIAILFPRAKIIHCRRNPLDNCFSIYTNALNDRHAYANNLSDLGWYYRQYSNYMDHWRAVLPSKMLEVQYENVVDNLENQVRRLLDFLGLPFDEACLNFQQNRRSVITMSRAQIRQPLYRTSVERWRPYETHLGPLISALSA